MGRGNAGSQGPSRSKQGPLLLGDGRGWETAATPVGSQSWGGAAGSLRALVREDQGRGRGGRDSWAQTVSFPRCLIDAVSRSLTHPQLPPRSTAGRARGSGREAEGSLRNRLRWPLQGLGRQPSA